MKVSAAIDGLLLNPYAGKKLEGEYAGHFSLRIWPYRVIYQIVKQELLIIVVRVGHRQGVY